MKWESISNTEPHDGVDRNELDFDTLNYLFKANDVRGSALDIISGRQQERDKEEERIIVGRLKYIEEHMDNTTPSHDTKWSIEPNGNLLMQLTYKEEMDSKNNKTIAIPVSFILRDLVQSLIGWSRDNERHIFKFTINVMSLLVAEYDFVLHKKKPMLKEGFSND